MTRNAPSTRQSPLLAAAVVLLPAAMLFAADAPVAASDEPVHPLRSVVVAVNDAAPPAYGENAAPHAALAPFEQPLDPGHALALVVLLALLLTIAAGLLILSALARRTAPGGRDALSRGEDEAAPSQAPPWRRPMAWLGEHPALPLTIAIHIAVLAMLVTVVVYEPTPPDRRASFGFGMAEDRDTDDDQADAQAAGGQEHDDEDFVPSFIERADDRRSERPSTSTEVSEFLDANGNAAARYGPERSELSLSRGGDATDAAALAAGRGALSNRGDGQQDGLDEHGGTAGTHDAVQAGLEWLRNHVHWGVGSDTDNRWWRPDEFDRDARNLSGGGVRCACMDDNHTAARNRGSEANTVGVTGLATLAFLANGASPTSGDDAALVAGAMRWLLRQQGRDGRFGDASMYNQAIATIAIAEALALVREQPHADRAEWIEALAVPLQRAVDAIERAQQLPHGGWDYGAESGRGRNDLSISAWCVMALTDAAMAGAEVSRATMLRVIHLLHRMTPDDGMTYYAEVEAHAFESGPGVVGSAAFMRMLLGCPPDDPMLHRQLDYLARHAPDRRVNDRDNNFATWYTGTLAAFFAGADHWTAWNASLRPTATSLQSRRGHQRGSWAGIGHWCHHGGRVYATAINTITLSIYYRYVPRYVHAAARQRYARYWENPSLIYQALRAPELEGARARPSDPGNDENTPRDGDDSD